MPIDPKNLVRIKEEAEYIKGLCDTLKAHVDAGNMSRANNTAMNIEEAGSRLFNMTYKEAYPPKSE